MILVGLEGAEKLGLEIGLAMLPFPKNPKWKDRWLGQGVVGFIMLARFDLGGSVLS